jgi:inner membrane protein
VPSPVGHFLGGAIVGTIAAAPSQTRRFVITCAVAACLPDLDFLWGRHNMETHSLGAAVMAGLVALALTRGRDPRLALAVVVAWASHVLFDWLGSDTTPPLGVVALWPWSSEYYFSNAFIFEAISRRYWLEGFWRHNILAVVSEVVMLGPPLVVLRWWRVRRAGRG